MARATRSARAASDAAPSPSSGAIAAAADARRLGQLLDVPESLATREELLLVAGLHARGRVDERLQLGQPERDGVGVLGQLVEVTSRGDELAPRRACVAPALELLGAAERVENVELERRPRKPALLELSGHRDQALGGRRDVLARHGPPPRVRTRAPVAEDAARDHEPGLVLRSELRERRELLVVEEAVRHVELGLDVRLGPIGADGRRVRARAEQEPDRLREDRLARTGLARDRVQAGREHELRLADEDEVLDAEPPKHARGRQ